MLYVFAPESESREDPVIGDKQCRRYQTHVQHYLMRRCGLVLLANTLAMRPGYRVKVKYRDNLITGRTRPLVLMRNKPTEKYAEPCNGQADLWSVSWSEAENIRINKRTTAERSGLGAAEIF